MAEEILYNKVANITFYTQINGRLKGSDFLKFTKQYVVASLAGIQASRCLCYIYPWHKHTLLLAHKSLI